MNDRTDWRKLLVDEHLWDYRLKAVPVPLVREIVEEVESLRSDLAAAQDELRDLEIELTRARKQRDIAHTLLRESKQWMICPGKYTAWEIMKRIDAALKDKP